MMTRSRLWILAALSVAAFALLTGFTHGQAGGGRGGKGKGMHGAENFMDRRMERVLDQLDLTAEQRQQIDAIRERLRASRPDDQTREAMRANRMQQMQEFWTADTPDVHKLRALVDQRAEMQRARGYQGADAMAEVHQILTPEQRAKVAQMLEELPKLQRKHEDQRRGRMKPGEPRQDQQQRGR